MRDKLKGKSFLTLKDFSKEEIRYILDTAHKLKADRKDGIYHQLFKGLSLAMIFEKPSTRTRCAFETAFGEEGGHPVFLSVNDIQLGKKESIEDTARVLGRMFDAIEFRGFKQETVNSLATHSGVPVFNGLTDLYHPTQILADLMTVEEHLGTLEGKTLVYAGDGRNNMAHSLMIGCAKMGVNITIISPSSLAPNEDVLNYSIEEANKSNSFVKVTEDMNEGLKGADVVYTDVWVSMGEEEQSKDRISLLQPYQINNNSLKLTNNSEVIFMHCLPAVRGLEVTNEVIEGSNSVVWDEAENRKHSIKAIMFALI
ncbi:ornithine carbamoyltransferase [Thiospirochaeta perfilievii]|uniref:Ornithine carbamoyltransferase n=1 Tax=Thiospirochaeta perfilievii TaxID=252967 RepID=A0A5C1Q983_9SPIO|nr:ornithine carbamoyltransferase [Thiospirochaeta perfilievii]QEN04071.1 ornithine carbamoyltransferase [Thiospirochaeta perfilievii]